MVGPLLRQVTEKQPPEDGCDRLLGARGAGRGPCAAVALPPADLVVLLDVDAAAVALRRGRPVVALASTKEDADAMHAVPSAKRTGPVAPQRENPFRGLRPRRALAAPAAGARAANRPVVVAGGAYLLCCRSIPFNGAACPRPAGPPRVLVSAGRSGRCEAEGNIISVGARSSRAAHTPRSSGSSGRDSPRRRRVVARGVERPRGTRRRRRRARRAQRP